MRDEGRERGREGRGKSGGGNGREREMMVDIKTSSKHAIFSLQSPLEVTTCIIHRKTGRGSVPRSQIR